MNAIILILTACLINDPTSCHEYHLSFSETQYIEGQPILLTPQRCLMSGQFEIVKYINDHPNLKPKKFKCVASDKMQAFKKI